MPGAQEPLVRVTLLKPMLNSDGQEQPVRLRAGQVSFLDQITTGFAIDPGKPEFQVPWNQDENVVAQGRRGPLERVDLHQDVTYEISMADGEQSTLLPVGIAKLHFGDWDLTPGKTHPMNPRVNHESERLRVAEHWGGYELFPYTKTSPNGTPIADIRKIGVPRVPHVKVELIDQRGNTSSDRPFMPWDFYQFEKLVDKHAAAEARRRMESEGMVTRNYEQQTVPPQDLEALIEAAVTKRLAQSKKAVASA
jgi:hypothetical protein